jgi:hypothetical protein
MSDDQCRHCGNPLLARRPLKLFCSYSCRGQLKALQATRGPSGLIGAKNTKQNKVLRGGKSVFSFTKINSSSYRLDSPNKRGVGWLLEVAWAGGSRQRWVARVGDRASDHLLLDQAKRAGVEIMRKRGKVESRDWIKQLNQIAANEVEPAALAPVRKQWPLDLMGGRAGAWPLDPGMRNAILSDELDTHIPGGLDRCRCVNPLCRASLAA